MVYNCRVCNIELTNENWYPSYQQKYKYICITCDKKSHKIKYNMRTDQERSHDNTIHRERNRKRYIYTTDLNGNRITIKTNKRPHTLICELCSKEFNKTCYHHWDDLHPEWGIWVCSYCHLKAEAIEDIEFINKYNSLKNCIPGGL